MEGVIGRLQAAQMKSLVATDVACRGLQEVRPRQAGHDGDVDSGSSQATLHIGAKTADEHLLRPRRLEAGRR